MEKGEGCWWILIILGLILWGALSGNSGDSSSSYGSSGVTNYGGYQGEYDNYESFVEEPMITSENWECIGDCSGHNAGYEWAADKGISDPGDCGGNSNSFIEGCEAWANEQSAMEDEYYDDYSYDSDYLY